MPDIAKPPGILPAVAGSIGVMLVVPAVITVLKSVWIVFDPTVNETATLLPVGVGAPIVKLCTTVLAAL